MTDSNVIHSFYDSFAKRNGEAMAACYHADATFSDPVFPSLTAEAAKNMWRMLCENGRDLEVSYKIKSSEKERTVVDWEARYTFSKTGRRVHNKVTSTLEIRAGKIFRHVDHFDFWKWSRQALGLLGWAFGWSPIVKNKIRYGAAQSLNQFSLSRDQ